MTTTTRITGPEASSSMYRERICCAVSPLIHTQSRTRNEVTPQSHATSTRVTSNHSRRQREKHADPEGDS